MMIEEYQKSLKIPRAEEILDLVFFRPIAFFLVRVVYRTRLTPNQLTAVSLLFGIASAVGFSSEHVSAVRWGAVLLVVANVLDCADGQLARLQQKGTLFGRVWDGVADYLSSIAIFVGIGIGFSNDLAWGLAGWWMVAAAGLSSALHAAVFDHIQSRYMATMTGNQDFLRVERDRTMEELRSQREKDQSVLKMLFLSAYGLYLLVQEKFTQKRSLDKTPGTDERMVRFWSFLGPTTNRTVLVVSALFGQIEFYLWTIAVGGNLWLLVCFVAQRRLERL